VADPISTSSQGVARKGEREGERGGERKGERGREREKEETPLILTGDSTSRSM
jgi:hypothetical protein